MLRLRSHLRVRGVLITSLLFSLSSTKMFGQADDAEALLKQAFKDSTVVKISASVYQLQGFDKEGDVTVLELRSSVQLGCKASGIVSQTFSRGGEAARPSLFLGVEAQVDKKESKALIAEVCVGKIDQLNRVRLITSDTTSQVGVVGSFEKNRRTISRFLKTAETLCSLKDHEIERVRAKEDLGPLVTEDIQFTSIATRRLPDEKKMTELPVTGLEDFVVELMKVCDKIPSFEGEIYAGDIADAGDFFILAVDSPETQKSMLVFEIRRDRVSRVSFR